MGVNMTALSFDRVAGQHKFARRELTYPGRYEPRRALW